LSDTSAIVGINKKGVGMDTNEKKARNAEIKTRIDQIQQRQQELSEIRREMAVQMAAEVGTEDDPGVSLDPIVKWARQMKKLNTEMKSLADERRELRAKRRELNPCDCFCH
jgi:hypothetical protein